MELTRESIMAMSSGRELDAMVAEHVIGKEVTEVGIHYYIEPIYKILPVYSTDLTAAWGVFQHMKQQLFSKRRYFMDRLSWVVIGDVKQPVAWPDIMWFIEPVHICKAALLTTLEGET